MSLLAPFLPLVFVVGYFLSGIIELKVNDTDLWHSIFVFGGLGISLGLAIAVIFSGQ